MNADGTVKNAVLQRSWKPGGGYGTLWAARTSKYIPGAINCKPVEGANLFREMLNNYEASVFDLPKCGPITNLALPSLWELNK